MKYTVLDNLSAINNWLSNGWQLYGSPFGAYHKEYEDVILYQAMIKEEE